MKKGMMNRNWLVGVAAVVLAVSLVSVAYLSADPKKYDYLDWSPSWWTGYSTAIPVVSVPEGYPLLPTHARYLGELKGSWYDIGRQYGERAGDLMVMVFDGWYGAVKTKMSWEEIRYRIQRYENESIKWYSPELLEIVEGMADGAANYFKDSAYYEESGMTPYEMVLAINLYFEINSYSPKIPEFQEAASLKATLADPSEGSLGCSSIALLPGATATGKVIHADSKDQSFWPQCYGVMYTMVHVGNKGPSGKPNILFRAGTAGELAGMNVVNDKGLTISGHAGGNKGVGTDPYYPDYTFGVPAQFAIAQAGFFSNNLEEGINDLVYGSDYYRESTGRKIVQWARSFNCLLSDLVSACTVEENPYRYAVRFPGYLGETDNAYIVQTNHNSCRFSYDENDELTDIPMTRFGDGSSTTSASKLDGSGTRFWTLMWLAKNNFGRIDEYEVMNEFWTRDFYFWENGFKDLNAASVTTVANKAGRTSGQVNTQLSIPSEHKLFWTVGTPPDWRGPWDSWVLEENFPKKIK